MDDERPVIRRRAARVVALSPQGRVLLFEGGDPDRPHVRIWHTPGGGVDPGESDRDAAVREYREETGVDIEVGPHVWDRELRFGFNGSVYDQVEVFFLAQVEEHVADTSGHNALERRYLGAHGWFTVEDLRSLPSADGSVLLAPPDLADRVAELLSEGPPVRPVRVQGVVLP